MISHGLETAGVGLVLDAVELAVGTGVRVSTGNDLLAQLGANLAVVALFLVLDAVAGCVAGGGGGARRRRGREKIRSRS